MEQPTLTKQQLRELLKQRRSSIPPEEKKRLDAAIVASITASQAYLQADTLLLYAPLSGEVDLLPLVRRARKDGKQVAFPRCDTETNTMRFHLLTPEARLSPGAYRIPEPPADAPICQPTESTLCLLPALSFDRAGNRLGYGKGFYDRFLEDFPGVTAGVVYAAMMLKQVPTEPHDKPVAWLFTERGMLQAIAMETAHQEDQAQEAVAAATPTLRQRLGALFASLNPKKPHGGHSAPVEGGEASPQKGTALRPLHAPPILIAAVFLLLILSRVLDPYLTTRNNEHAVMILLQVLVFAIPAVIYGKLRGEALTSAIRMRRLRVDQIWFLVSMLVVMMSGSLLFGILTGGVSSLGGNFTLYDTFVAHIGNDPLAILSVILAYALLPAFCEELVCRSILCAEYEKYGVAVSIAVSALFFSMMHFSFPLFLTYLLLGGLLAAAMYTTRSFFGALLLHAGYNLFCLFGQPYLTAFYLNAGSNEIFIFCLVVLFLLFSAFAAGEARKLYHRYARANLPSDYTTAASWKVLPRNFFFALLSPAGAAVVVIWLIMAIVNL